MKVLNLIIKQKYFDLIMRGQKVQEFREIRPTTEKRYLEMGEDGYAKETDDGNVVPVRYDAIHFFVGYAKDRDNALVEVKGAHVEFFVDDNGKPIMYEYKGEQVWAAQIVYDLGRIIKTDIRPK